MLDNSAKPVWKEIYCLRSFAFSSLADSKASLKRLASASS